MSKIEEALEKAKKMREEMGSEEKVSPVEPPLLPQYTQTRVIQTDLSRLEKNKIIAATKKGDAYEYYRFLKTEVLHRMEKNGWNCILITSVLPGEGKTLTAINLAITLTREVTKTVLLMEADLRNPSMAKFFKFPEQKGLADYLIEDGISLSDILVNPGIEKLVILPAGKLTHDATEALGSPKMQNLIRELKNRYENRLILIDSPPLLTFADALTLSPYVDAVLLVVEVFKTTIEQVKMALELLEGRSLLGIVLNKAPTPEKTGYYSYNVS